MDGFGGLAVVVASSLLLFLTGPTTAISKCVCKPVECSGMKLERVGCYADNQMDRRPLPKMFFTDVKESHPFYSGQKMNEPDRDTYMTNLICRCARKALSRGYNMIGLQHYGECWSGENTVTSQTFNRDGPSDNCITWKGERCPSGKDCIGEDNANFIYKVKDKAQTAGALGISGSLSKPTLRPFPIEKTAKPAQSPPKPTILRPFPSPKTTEKAAAEAEGLGSLGKPISRPFPTEETAKPVHQPPLPPPISTESPPNPTTLRPFPSPKTTKKAVQPTEHPPFPSPVVTSTGKSTGSPLKTTLRPFPSPQTTNKTTAKPSPLVTGTSTAESTGSPTQPPSKPSNRPPPASYPQCLPQCHPGYNIRYVPVQVPQQTPYFQVPQSMPHPACPQVVSCPTVCYPTCSYACCRSKLGKKITKAKSKLEKKTKVKRHQKRAVLADLNEVF